MRFLSGAALGVGDRVRALVTSAASSFIRPRRAAVWRITIAAAVVVPIFILGQGLPASSASFQQLQAKINRLNDQIEITSQAYASTQDKMDSMNVVAKAATQRASVASARLGSARAQLAGVASALYRSGNLSTLQLVMGDDAQSMLAQQGLAVSLADRQAEVIRRYTNAQRDVTSARADYSGRMKDLQVLAAQQRTRIKDLKAKVKAVEVQLSRLTTGQRALLTTSRASLRAGLTCGQAGIPTASGAAGKAVEYACSKVGDSYVWAAAGPNTFDCSGLTLRAWEQAGVHLPHSADDQFHRGRRVALADIQPGDLVFYHYSGGFQHLGMYVGNGYAIHAPHTGDVVRLYLISQYVPAAIARL